MSVTGSRPVSGSSLSADVLNAPVVTQADLLDTGSMINQSSLSGKRKGALVYVVLTSGTVTTAVASGSSPSDAWEFTDRSLYALLTEVPVAAGVPTRKKVEVTYSGLSLVIPTTPTNLINLIKGLTPASGTLSPFFNTTTDKLNVFNDDRSLQFKINLTGSWTSSSGNRSISLDFSSTSNNKLTANRVNNITPDTVQLSTFFSVNKDGNLVTGGTPIMIQSFGSTFLVTDILLIADQETIETVISSV
ncbi:MAG: hypothetical protein [Caudoviricetes sp.]|nr:MAG: hypothetical protein [Caudoviricetes sp.]